MFIDLTVLLTNLVYIKSIIYENIKHMHLYNNV